jgi:hypothetical protein
MGPTLISFLLLLIFSGLAAFIVDRLLRPSLRDMLDSLVEMPAATTFYVRTFTATIFLAVLAHVFGGRFGLKSDSRFMEYVWELASNLEDSLQNIFVVLLIFAGIFVILLASLRRKR